MNEKYKYLVSGAASELYPAETFFGLLYYNQDDVIEIPKEYPFHKQWGYPQSFHMMEEEENPLPKKLDAVWLSLVEGKFYSIIHEMPVEKMKELFQTWDDKANEPLYEFIIFGMAPYGGAALWLFGNKKSVILDWLHAEEVRVDMKDFSPLDKNVTLIDYCDTYINNDEAVRENLEVNGLPPRHLFDKYMQQFCYRYLPLFQQWDEDEQQWKRPKTETEGDVDKDLQPELDFIEEALYDGTHDKLHDGSLLSYHLAGKPKKLAVQWHIKKSEYSAYLWLDDESICEAFERFYGAHRDTKVDIIIRIDSEKKKLELALYRYGLKEPVVINEDAYQMIVFKNKFEYYRSENYDQPRGAWIW
jgi:hypothetical protein